MRTFPTQHPSLGSVKNVIATGCPGIVHSQMDSSQWKSTYEATIVNQEPTLPKRRCAPLNAPSARQTPPHSFPVLVLEGPQLTCPYRVAHPLPFQGRQARCAGALWCG